MKRLLLTVVCCVWPALGQNNAEEVTVRRAASWNSNANDGWCEIRVWVDEEAEIGMQGDRLKLKTVRGRATRDNGSTCSAPIPANVQDFRFRTVDGRGEVQVLEPPDFRNRWEAVIRIRDTRPGADYYYYRLDWGRGGTASGGGGSNSGNSGSGGGSAAPNKPNPGFNFGGGSSSSGGSGSGNSGGTPIGNKDSGPPGNSPFFNDNRDITRFATRDLRTDIEKIYNDIWRRRPSPDEVDGYIDRVRFNSWTYREIARDVERRR
jgi:hypothetical protein